MLEPRLSFAKKENEPEIKEVVYMVKWDEIDLLVAAPHAVDKWNKVEAKCVEEFQKLADGLTANETIDAILLARLGAYSTAAPGSVADKKTEIKTQVKAAVK